MGNIYTETIELRACRCDMFGQWKPSAILETMQETAGAHSEMLDLGRDEMARLNLGWVIARLKADFNRMPAIGEKISIDTYPTANRHLFYPRSHIFRDEAGEIIGSANTLWLVMDLATRKMVNSEEILAKMPDNRDLKPAAGLPSTVKSFEGEVKTSIVAPQFTDLDTNGHVNNTKYLDWCCNALGLENLKDSCIMSFDANYDAEILPGVELRTELTMDGNQFAFCGFSGSKRHFSIGGRLGSRK